MKQKHKTIIKNLGDRQLVGHQKWIVPVIILDLVDEMYEEWRYDKETIKRLNKNLSGPSALERTPACYPPVMLLRLWGSMKKYAGL